MTTQTESIVCIYDAQKKLTAILKRDEATGKKVIYMVEEADTEQIELLINPEHTLI